MRPTAVLASALVRLATVLTVAVPGGYGGGDGGGGKRSGDGGGGGEVGGEGVGGLGGDPYTSTSTKFMIREFPGNESVTNRPVATHGTVNGPCVAGAAYAAQRVEGALETSLTHISKVPSRSWQQSMRL